MKPEFTPRLCILESQTKLSEEVTLESWFIREGLRIIRSEVYKLEDGSVVAFQDSVEGKSGPLYMDAMFKAMYEDEPSFCLILHCSGVLDPTKIKLYHLS